MSTSALVTSGNNGNGHHPKPVAPLRVDLTSAVVSPEAPEAIIPARRQPEQLRVTLVIPAMNEENNIEWVLDRVPARVGEIILVDGHSADNTVELARRARPDIVVVQQRGRGKGAALRAGFEVATGDVIVMMDSDGSMEPAEITSFVRAVEQGYEFVKGSRCVAGGGSADLTPVRRLGNRALTATVNVLFLVPFSDLCYGFVAFRKDTLERLALTARGFEFETEIAIHAIKAGLRIAEVPSVESPRRYGTSNLRAVRDGQRVLRTIARERMSRRSRPVVDCLLPEDLHDLAAVSGELSRPNITFY
ncbi:MAG: glycosyltransferase family 2 protein [Nocardioidaceae bacterium]